MQDECFANHCLWADTDQAQQRAKDAARFLLEFTVKQKFRHGATQEEREAATKATEAVMTVKMGVNKLFDTLLDVVQGEEQHEQCAREYGSKDVYVMKIN